MANSVWYTQNILICCLLPGFVHKLSQKLNKQNSNKPKNFYTQLFLVVVSYQRCYHHLEQITVLNTGQDKKTVKCPKSKCKHGVWLSQTEMQSCLYNKKSAMYCVTCFLLSTGCFLWANSPFAAAGCCYSWWAAFRLCREPWVTLTCISNFAGRACISTTSACTTIYTCVKKEGNSPVLLNWWQFSVPVCQKLRSGSMGRRQNCNFLWC